MNDNPIQQFIDRMNKSIHLFHLDPPVTDYQKGYLAGLKAARREARDLVPQRPKEG
jgi:hypothetical protein